MKVRRFPSADAAAVYVAAHVEHLLLTHPHPVLGLATGSTPIKLYQQLVAFHRQGLSFRHATAINLDEYVGLAPDHPESYHRFMEENLFRHIDIGSDNTHIPHGDASDLKAECLRYDALIESHPIDLQILGIGRNGHIGFNEPGSVLKTRTQVVQLTEDTIRANARFFPDAANVPTRAVTMGLESILGAKRIILMAFGRDKAQAVQQALSGDVSTAVPASFLQMHPHALFVLDEEAAACLPRDARTEHFASALPGQ